MEKLPAQNKYDKDPEFKQFLELYPLQEEFKDKFELAFELKKISNKLEMAGRHQIIYEFASNLRIKYPDAGNYWLWRIIVGASGTKITRSDKEEKYKFDFEGNDSIEKFLKLQELSMRLDD